MHTIGVLADMNRGTNWGARIWLSGSIPVEENTSAHLQPIYEFTARFARLVFQSGGHILHGADPSITPVLIDEAARHQREGGRKDCLMLAVSRYWSKHTNTTKLAEWRRSAIVYEAPEGGGLDPRHESLQILRKWMASRCDATVCLGGKLGEGITDRSGIPIELELAIARQIPTFILGGFGGMAQRFSAHNPEIFTKLRNGLDIESNLALFRAENAGQLAETICRQLQRLPLVHGCGADGASFRILALDGGGIRGTFTAAALAAWENHTGQQLHNHFDLVAGTSTGGILAIGLGLGLSAQEMLEFYKCKGPVIFPLTRFYGRLRHNIRHIVGPKHSQDVLLRELRSAYYRNCAPINLKASKCRLLIPTYHAVAGASHQFRTPHHPDLTADANLEAAHAALATAAAPTFYHAAKLATKIAESSYFDGGVWANSPVMAAIIEAVCFLRIPLERLDILSVGTTEELFTTARHTQGGILRWMWKKKIVDLLMNVQQESSLKLAQHLVGPPRFLRVSAQTPTGSYPFDSPNCIRELADLGQYAALQVEILAQVKSRFLNGIPSTPWEMFS